MGNFEHLKKEQILNLIIVQIERREDSELPAEV